MNFRGIIGTVRDADKRLGRRFGDARRVLVDARTPMNFAVMAPIVKALQRDPRISFRFISSEDPGRARDVFRDVEDAETVIDPRRAATQRFDAYLAADLVWAKLPRGSARVFLFHGVAGKYADVYDRPNFSMRHWDRIFFINRRRLNSFVTAGAIDPDSPAAKLIGYPKLDCLVDGSLRRDDVINSLGMNPASSVVLYAPTWSPHSSLNIVGEELVSRLCGAGYKVIVKLHDRSLQPEYEYSGGVDWAGRLVPVLSKSGGLLARGSDATRYMAAADVMITDHSSAGFEYLLLDRPLIRIDMPQLIAMTRIDPDYVRLMKEAALTVRTVAEAVAAVEDGLTDPSTRSVSRKAVADELFYEPGTATARAVHELCEVIELEPTGDACMNRSGSQKLHI